MADAGWQVEDGFFGALLGAVLGVIAPSGPPVCFVLLIVLLVGIVLLINRAGEAAGMRRMSLIVSALLFTVVGCVGLRLVGFLSWERSLWLIAPICAWVLVKVESRLRLEGA